MKPERAQECTGARVLDQCGEPWRRAIYLPPEPLPALGHLPTRQAQRRSHRFTAGRIGALLLAMTLMGLAIVIGVSHVV